MTTKKAPSHMPDTEPTLRQMLALWLPLAASIAMMVLEPSVINIGLGRTADAELALAAYGVAFSLALLVEAPILMLLDASVARATDRAAFGLIRRFALALGLIVTAIGLVVTLSPLYVLIVEGLMNIPTNIAAEARPTLQILAFWSLPIASRPANRGSADPLATDDQRQRGHRCPLVTLALACSSACSSASQGAVVARFAMVLQCHRRSGPHHCVCAVCAPVPVEISLQTLRNRSTSLTLRGLSRFYRPLGSTTILRRRPGRAQRSHHGHQSRRRLPGRLARRSGVLPCWSPVPGLSFQQLTTALAHGPDTPIAACAASR